MFLYPTSRLHHYQQDQVLYAAILVGFIGLFVAQSVLISLHFNHLDVYHLFHKGKPLF